MILRGERISDEKENKTRLGKGDEDGNRDLVT